MKLAIYASLAASAYAGLAELSSAMDEYENNQNFETSVEEAEDEFGGLSAAASAVAKALKKNSMKLLSNYGCWCYFEEDHGKGRGAPVNQIDSFCKTLSDGYDCLMYDWAETHEDECIPWKVHYQSATGIGIPGRLNVENLRTECNRQNPPGSCEAETCIVEGYFLQSFFKYSAKGGTIDVSKRHKHGFNPNQECPVGAPGNDGDRNWEWQCCGQVPFRYPYRNNGEKDCCGDKTFKTGILQCCEDKTVAIHCD